MTFKRYSESSHNLPQSYFFVCLHTDEAVAAILSHGDGETEVIALCQVSNTGSRTWTMMGENT